MVLISAIIPAYNESNRIQEVLETLSSTAVVGEIIVVDDGSTDDTPMVIQSLRERITALHYIRHTQNQGKGQTVLTGLNSTQADVIVMVDADLQGFRPAHVQDLITPVVTGDCDMTLGVFKGGNWKTDFSHWATPWLSGQRCIRRDKFAQVNTDAASGYGLEAALTVAATQYHWKVKRVALRGVSHPISEEHRGIWGGLFNRAKMYYQVMRGLYRASSKQRYAILQVRDKS